ncbi:MAG: hypothetical protein PHP86_04925 [Nevskiales bacterium]|nr:hypothetical protein [Nevskiales bacterium]
MVAVENGARAQVGDVRSPRRLGDGQCGDFLAAQDRCGEALLLFRGPGMDDRRGADAVRHQACDQAAAAGPRQFFGQDDHVKQIGNFDAAAGFRKTDLQDSGFRRGQVQFAGERFGSFPASDIGGDFPVDEAANLLPEAVVLRSVVRA